MNTDNKDDKVGVGRSGLPAMTHLPVNRCNLPTQILGSLNFQIHPVPLRLDGVHALHKQLFELLDSRHTPDDQANTFMDYMVVQFRLHQLQDAGLIHGRGRGKADYLRLLRGWLFNTNGREAAVLKAWVESRFGLLARYHNGSLKDYETDTYQAYLAASSHGLYGTNALESQLDLLYSYCQYTLDLQHFPDQHILLYRGINRIDNFDILSQADRHSATILLNNLNSFSSNRERAEEFGDILISASVPLQKIMYYSSLLPGLHIGENEYLVIGGVYEVNIAS